MERKGVLFVVARFGFWDRIRMELLWMGWLYDMYVRKHGAGFYEIISCCLLGL